MRKLRLVLILLLVILIAITVLSTGFNSSRKVYSVYEVEDYNQVTDGSFEFFNKKPNDCCSYRIGNASFLASKSADKVEGSFSLNLSSANHCACTDKPLTIFNNSENYLLTFDYKGDNPRFCNWVSGENKCMPENKLNASMEWKEYKTILMFTPHSNNSIIHFYAD